jgi:hypothetical protein
LKVQGAISAISRTGTMLERIISGGQTGADQAAWQTAQAFGLTTSGWMPKGFLTEAGPRPEFAKQYGAVEMQTDSYAARTEKNVRDSDATVWFGETTTAGAHDTVRACRKFAKPCMPVYQGASFEPSHVASWIAENQVNILNVAGNRESDEPGISNRVERFLGQVLQHLGIART